MMASAPASASPANDMLLCPITMNEERFLPDFATPKEEEEWWNDFLAPPPDSQQDFAERETPSVSESHITTFSPERSLHGFNESDPQDRTMCDLTPPSSPRLLSPLQAVVPTVRRCLSQPDIAVKQESSIEQIDFKEEEDDDEEKPDIESTDSDDSDEYGLVRRRSRHEKRRATQKSLSKPPRIHKPRQKSRAPLRKSKGKSEQSTARKKVIRRRQITVSSEELQRLCAERARLRAGDQVAEEIKIPSPLLGEDGQWWCAHARDDGNACRHASTRAGEARRHTLTHLANLRFLCSNPTCPLAFSREDAVNRHIGSSSYTCKEMLPPGITKDSPKDAIVHDGQTWRLANLVWDT